MQQLKILAVIPARKGSKGLPSKNSKSINGKPLISWTIDAALNSKHISQVCVSSDCERIQEIAINQGVDVPRLRPKILSQDDTPLYRGCFTRDRTLSRGRCHLHASTNISVKNP